jgi:DNA sulfur modification protein DndD
VIIKSIEINNFLSYYGKSEFRFDRGATIIIGQNNSGKSKLFDAYNWVLYDEAFKTEAEAWESTQDWGQELGNRLAMQRCKINGHIEILVALEFEDEVDNSYLVTRTHRIKKLAEDRWDTSLPTSVQVTRTEAGTHNRIPLTAEDIKVELERFFPKNLSRYFLFQGENISKLMRLNQRSDFTRAISELSGIKYFAKAKIYARDIYERAKITFEEKSDSVETVQNEKERLSREIDAQQELIDEVQAKKDNEVKERDQIEALHDEKLRKLAKYEACATILDDIKKYEEQRDQAIMRKKQLYEHNHATLISEWIYGGSEDDFRNYLSMYRMAKDDKKIPEPIRQDFIKEMIEEELCKVCGTHAPKGSAAYTAILQHLNEKALDKEVAIINTLSDTADIMATMIRNLSGSANTFRSELTAVNEDINRARELMVQKEDELDVVIENIAAERNEEISRQDIEKVNILKVKQSRDQLRNDLEKSKSKIAQFIGNLEILDEGLKKLLQDYENLIDQSANELEKRRMKLALQIKGHVDRLHDSFLTKLIYDIEAEANSYFASMTEGSEALSGRVRVDYQAREVYVIDETGARVSNINQANKVSLQIAFVAAVLSVSNKIWGSYFPFVADAPISALGGNNKIGAIKTMISIFRQSIIILKDDARTGNEESLRNDEVRQLIQYNPQIKHAYELSIDRSSGKVLEQFTTVSTLK